MLKETLEKIKQEYIILNVEINRYKSVGSIWDQYDVPTHKFSNEFLKMKSELESSRTEIEKLKYELNYREKGKNNEIPKWIINAKTKGKEGLGYVTDNKKKKFYVDLPSNKVCSFCGKTGHLKY